MVTPMIIPTAIGGVMNREMSKSHERKYEGNRKTDENPVKKATMSATTS